MSYKILIADDETNITDVCTKYLEREGYIVQVFSRNQLLNQIWDINYFGDTTTVTVHIRRLREKIEPVPSEPSYIKTVWGIGYKFDGKEV